MAHILDIASQLRNGYVDGRKLGDQVKYPDTGTFQGFNSPCRLEGDIFDLEVEGKIPPEISGTFYRVQPDHRFPPVFEEDIHFNGDGNITAIRIKNGHADYKQRYVVTDRLIAESTARKSLFGKYRNPFTDSEAVKGVIRTSANTNVTFWRGMLLASKEDGPPYAMDPITLETIGRYDFEGQIQAPTFTAHPKFDPETGEMICFAYEAGGDGNDGSCDIAVWTINPDGRKTEEVWYKAPFCGMIHDCGISKNYVVLPMTPLKCSLDRLQKGGNHWAWDPTEDQWYGIVPRRGGRAEDIVWLRSDNDGNVFFFFPPDDEAAGDVAKRNQVRSPTCRWVFDPKSPSGSRVKPNLVWDTSGEFSRIDDRFVTKKYNHFWQARIDPKREYDAAKCGSPAGGLFNCIAHYTWEGQTEDVYWAGPRATFQEPSFIPKEDGSEGEGWLIALLNHLDVLRNDIVILDALNIAAGPVATIKLPLKLRLGLHGNFVDERDIEVWKERRKVDGAVGPVKPAQRPLAWQLKASQGNNFGGEE
ncbi:hypothetical protein G7Z17_g4582 [Cylindrodendrum hubeiense]|uniref:Uncharacterized protein n=1 Tax=Cylindrodendrum hubeiense TaxID=595255 RepID=A0A9P5HDQ9_9HYPO|nr:hypothetical protein G7Z17_g4582 [Cylindrodendrum hubeiense]